MDKEFFVREIDRNSGKLFRVAYSLLQNREDCRDAMQECALKAWEKRSTLCQEQYFATWITRILINECPYGIIMTQRKSLVAQGFEPFVAVISIPFPALKSSKTPSREGGPFHLRQNNFWKLKLKIQKD